MADHSAAGHFSKLASHSRPTESQAEVIQTIGDLVRSRSFNKTIHASFVETRGYSRAANEGLHIGQCPKP